VPDPRPTGGPASASGAQPESSHAADHAAIDRLAAELLPALIARLGSTGLGELEVRQDGWRVRLRRPADGAHGRERRTTPGASRAQPGHAGHAHGPVPAEGHRPPRAATSSTNGSSPGQPVPVGPGPAASGTPVIPVDGPTVATSPAVGIFKLNADSTPGRRVRAGDRIGVVDMLGVAQEVVAPVDGVLGETLVDSGDAVEYGQELVVIQFAASPVGEG
jgi:acetyl-CoA carboxylase biotin carboxyl carrier protein